MNIIQYADEKIEKIIRNYIQCILAEKKQGKQEVFLNSLEEGNIPLDTYRIDHLEPLSRLLNTPYANEKIEKIIRNCIQCILADKKQGKQEVFLNSLEKGSIPLDIYHIDHLGPLPTTQKRYQRTLATIDCIDA